MEKIISKKQYLNLCKICDTFLLSNKASLARLANPYFSIIKEHPLYLEKYWPLFNKKKGKFKWVDRLDASSGYRFHYFHLLYFFFLKIIKIFKILINFKYWYCKQIRFSKYDYIILTHLISEKITDDKEDFYFGNVPNELVKKNKKVLVVYINHTLTSPSKIIHKIKDKTFSQILLNDYLNPFLEFTFILRVFIDNLFLRRLLKNERDEFINKIISNASSTELILQTISNLRIGEQVKRIVKIYQPKVIMTTFEGQPYERIVYRMSKEALNSIVRIGYIPAGLSQYQHCVRRKLSNLYDPDQIMTPGKISYNQIINFNNFINTKFSILGSHKKNVKIKTQSIFRPNNYNTFLVLPEGMPTECKIMLDFTIKCSKEITKSIFIFRLHPYNQEILLKNLMTYYSTTSIPKNIIFSKNNLEDDMLISNFAIYRGSTAIINAVNNKLIPVYYSFSRNPGTLDLTIDPLYEINEGKYTVRNVLDLKKLHINLKNQNKSLLLKNNISTLQDYCRDWYTVYDFNLFDNLI